MKKNIWLYLILISICTNAIQSYAQCPPEGKDKNGNVLTGKKAKINIAKNRSSEIPAGLASYVSLSEILYASYGEDSNDFIGDEYVYMEGYLVDFTEQGPESCNCYEAEKSLKNGDVHIYVGLTKNALKKDCICVEITPEFKELNPEYETLLKKNTIVRIFGYMFYDPLHRSNAANTCTSCSQVWRKTNWEIHPIVAIEPLPKKHITEIW